MSSVSSIFLFENQTTNANSTPKIVPYSNKVAIVKVWGTFDGADIKFQSLAPQSSPAVWIDIPDINANIMIFRANGQRALQYLIQNEQIRAVLSNAGAGTSITATLEIY